MGSHILQSLLSRPTKHSITILSRPESSSPFPSSVKVLKVDYTSASSITTALQNIDFLIITLPATASPDLHPRIVQAAAAAGVKYIMPNYFGYALSDPSSPRTPDPILDAFERSVNDVRNAGVTFIALACGFWYEWSLGIGQNWYGFDIKARKVTFYDDGLKKINTSTWGLCGDAVAAILDGDLDQWANKAVHVSSFLVSQRDMLDSLHRVLGTSDADWEIEYQGSEERVKEAMSELQAGNRMGFPKALYAKTFFADGRGDFETKYGLDNGKLGLKGEELDEATRRTVELVEAGFGFQSWVQTGKITRLE
jgi:uncharacterized protein YbjT (DUF2867 family)